MICPYYCSTDREPLCWATRGICHNNPFRECETAEAAKEEKNEQEEEYDETE